MMKRGKQITVNTYSNLLGRIGEILNQARAKVVIAIDKIQVLTYREIGREIVEFEQKGKARAEYGEQLIMKLSADLSAKFGRGFKKSNLFLMRQFYLAYPGKFQTVSGKSSKLLKFHTLSEELKISQDPVDKYSP